MFGRDNPKIIKLPGTRFLNIGTLLFGTVFLYLVIFVFNYLTQTHVTSYEVVRGTISGNYRFSALSLREEITVEAERSGQISYYAREGTKCSSGSAICSIVDSTDVQQIAFSDFNPEDADLDRVRSLLSTFSMSYDPAVFQKTYDLQSGIQGLLSEITRDLDDDYVSVLNRCYAPESGFVVYALDGFEQLTEEQLNSDMFNQSTYNTVNLREDGSVRLGDTIYKLITSENWKLCFPLDEKMASELSGIETIHFRFLKDNRDFTAPFTILSNPSGFYGEISMNSSLVRYATERFLDIELILNKETGLKIPSSAIIEKEFYRIPEEFVIPNENTKKEITLQVEHFHADGSSSIQYITANVYSYSDGYYLVNRTILESGDYIIKEGTAKRFELGNNDITVLHGVYNINKGYAVFREVTVIDQNEEYCIVKDDNVYGLAAYDYIVLNAADVDVDQIIN